MNTNKIEKQIVLPSPRSRVWRALTDSAEFGSWFGMKLDGPFQSGQTIKGHIVPTTVDPEVAKMQEPHTGTPAEFFVQSIEPEFRFCIQWHPFAIDPKVDYSQEPMTLITFSLEDVEGGTLLTITESGFEKIPAWRREDALKANAGGWAHQLKLIEKYLTIR